MSNDYSNLSITETLCPIGDLCKVCGVTRRMVLNYEEHGLIKPIEIHEESGHRYYGAQSVARVRHIKSLQNLGLSLDNIRTYMEGDEKMLREHLAHLYNMQEEIKEQISRTIALLTPLGELSVHEETLPSGHYAMTTEKCETPQERFLLLWRFTAYVLKRGWRVANKGGLISILHTVTPPNPKSGMTSVAWALAEPNEESIWFEEKKALCVNLKGPYDQIPKAIALLRQYAAEHSLPADGDIRMVYLTSPQSHADPNTYATKVFLEL